MEIMLYLLAEYVYAIRPVVIAVGRMSNRSIQRGRRPAHKVNITPAAW